MYFIKWKGLPVSEASWVDENNFDTKELIRKYLSKNPEKEKEEEIAERHRRSERVRVQRYVYLGNLIYLINLIIFFMPVIAGKPVRDLNYEFRKGFMSNEIWNFNKASLPFCYVPQNRWPVNINNICSADF